jgi:hypothetical protein
MALLVVRFLLSRIVTLISHQGNCKPLSVDAQEALLFAFLNSL